MLGLPEPITACLFDLDGVLTTTALVHMAAWKQTFDEFLQARDGTGYEPFSQQDYDQHVDGRPRADGVREFLHSRGIALPEGSADDQSDAQTVNGVGNRKNDLLLELIKERGVTAYPGSVRYLEAARDAGLAIGVVTASQNAEAVLAAANLSQFVQVRIDGVVVADQGLRGKPAPDSYLAGVRALGVEPAQAAVFEDALAGVEAGRAGAFGFVVGVDRVGQAVALLERGADLAVTDLAELLTTAP